MRVVVTIPERVYRAAERASKRLGVSRNRLYARALEAHLAKCRVTGVTRRLNAVYAHEDSRLDEAVARAQSAAIAKVDW